MENLVEVREIGNYRIKEDALEHLQDSTKTLEMWLWGDVKGFALERKVPYTKIYDDPSRSDEKGFDWEEIDSCGGYYLTADELIDEVISEHCLTENA